LACGGAAYYGVQDPAQSILEGVMILITPLYFLWTQLLPALNSMVGLPTESTVPSSNQKSDFDTRMTAIRTLRISLANRAAPAVLEQLDYIIDRCSKIQQVVEHDGRLAQSEQFLNQYLIPIHEWFDTYARLKSRDLDLAEQSIQESETTMLPLVATKINAFLNQLHVVDIAKLSTANIAIELAEKAHVQLEVELHS
jgi:hypothetical protein